MWKKKQRCAAFIKATYQQSPINGKRVRNMTFVKAGQHTFNQDGTFLNKHQSLYPIWGLSLHRWTTWFDRSSLEFLGNCVKSPEDFLPVSLPVNCLPQCDTLQLVQTQALRIKAFSSHCVFSKLMRLRTESHILLYLYTRYRIEFYGFVKGKVC